MAYRTIYLSKEALRFVEFLARRVQAGERLVLIAQDGDETDVELPDPGPEKESRRRWRTAEKAGLIQRR